MRINDCVFIETTQVYRGTFPGSVQQGTYASWPGYPTAAAGSGTTSQTAGGIQYPNAPAGVSSPAGTVPVYTALAIGDNAFGHAISLPVELRDGGVLDFGFTAA